MAEYTNLKDVCIHQHGRECKALPHAGRPYGRTARWPSVQPYSTVLPLSDSSETFKHTPVYSLKPIQNIFYL